MPWLRGLGLVGAVVMAATAVATTALADPDLVSRPTPGMHVVTEAAGAQQLSRPKITTAATTCSLVDTATHTTVRFGPTGRTARSG
jgi:hypothetical protein